MIKLFRDDAAKSIFIEDNNGAQFPNSLQAIKNTDDSISIIDLARSIEIVSSEVFSEFVDENLVQYGNDADSTVNALNAEFSADGTSTNNIPVITSNLGVSLTQGETLNYELTADYGVGYEWDLSNVAGVTTVDGNPRKLIGGSSLAVGSYNIPVKAINYNGEDSETIVLTVSNPPFANTKSVRFNQNDWLGANAALLDSVLGRSGNGSGSGDAWTISFYMRRGTSTNNNQTLFYFGYASSSSGNLRIRYRGNDKSISLEYGTTFNNLILSTSSNSIPDGDWHHILISYDGGTTGAASGSVNNYYSRFKIFIDSVQQTTTNSHSNFGFTGDIVGQNLRVGRYTSGNYLRNNVHMDELAIWDSDQSSNAASIFNSFTPFDLLTLASPPKHWWRMGDGDTYPFLQDNGSEANCIFQMYNMTAADIVSDTP